MLDKEFSAQSQTVSTYSRNSIVPVLLGQSILKVAFSALEHYEILACILKLAELCQPICPTTSKLSPMLLLLLYCFQQTNQFV